MATINIRTFYRMRKHYRLDQVRYTNVVLYMGPIRWQYQQSHLLFLEKCLMIFFSLCRLMLGRQLKTGQGLYLPKDLPFTMYELFHIIKCNTQLNCVSKQHKNQIKIKHIVKLCHRPQIKTQFSAKPYEFESALKLFPIIHPFKKFQVGIS